MRGMLFVGLYLLAMLAHANVVVPGRDALRYRTETDPHGLIADMRQQLDQLGGQRGAGAGARSVVADGHGGGQRQ